MNGYLLTLNIAYIYRLMLKQNSSPLTADFINHSLLKVDLADGNI